jgi:hypothetical protein
MIIYCRLCWKQYSAEDLYKYTCLTNGGKCPACRTAPSGGYPIPEILKKKVSTNIYHTLDDVIVGHSKLNEFVSAWIGPNVSYPTPVRFDEKWVGGADFKGNACLASTTYSLDAVDMPFIAEDTVKHKAYFYDHTYHNSACANFGTPSNVTLHEGGMLLYEYGPLAYMLFPVTKLFYQLDSGFVNPITGHIHHNRDIVKETPVVFASDFVYEANGQLALSPTLQPEFKVISGIKFIPRIAL